jgi:DNA-binding IclR family transcriptional regulator
MANLLARRREASAIKDLILVAQIPDSDTQRLAKDLLQSGMLESHKTTSQLKILPFQNKFGLHIERESDFRRTYS